MQSSMLNMRKTEIGDLDFVLETERDSENAPFIGQWTCEQHAASLTDEDAAHFIVENQHGEKAGYVILLGLNDSHKSVCIKRITIRMKSRGYGKEALRLVIRWVFANTDAHRLWLHVKDYNDRARHVYESVGFIHEGTLRESYWHEGKFESIDVMSILRQECKHDA